VLYPQTSFHVLTANKTIDEDFRHRFESEIKRCFRTALPAQNERSVDHPVPQAVQDGIRLFINGRKHLAK
jgi:hypothetical protein